MAILHSRIRRVIFGVTMTDYNNDNENSSFEIGAFTGNTTSTTSTATSKVSNDIQMTSPIHSLPGANHHYRVFQCCDYHGGTYKECQRLHSIFARDHD